MKLMSLFDGSGGFPLAGGICGIEPVYASEIEPYPIAVTKSRFPKMKHLGNVADVKGDQIEPVDIITFGSPCQDMSLAGKRAGLKHTAAGDDETTRSGMFIEAIRIIKEMRNKTNGVYPRYAVWENVPGAFSSNKGEDFRTVLEEFIRISEPDAVMPAVPKAGWAYADCISGNGWSIAYRTFDAQYWGVPQRRRRIYLVADFRGGRAGEILFKREGLRGHTAQSGTQGQEIAGDIGNGIKADDRKRNCLTAYSFDSLSSNSMKSKNPHSGCRVVEIAKTIDTGYPDPSKNQGGIAIVEKIILDDQGGKQINVRSDGKSPTLRAEAHGNVPYVINKKTLVYDTRGNCDGETVPTITGDHNNRVTDYTALCIEKTPVYCLQGNGIDRADTAGCNGKGWREDKCYTLNTIDRPAVVYCMAIGQANAEISKDKNPTLNCNHEQPIVAAIDCRNLRETGYIYGTLQAKPNGEQSLNYSGAVCVNYIVRRLTPTECARLQGFPDKWGHPDKKEDFTEEEYKFWLEVRNTYAKINGKPEKEYTKAQMLTWYSKLHTASAEYKMWGNGIALINALYVMQGIVSKGD